MKMNLAIIGASYLQLPLILKAKEMGYTTHVFAWAADDVGENEADYFYPISIKEKERILEKCIEIGICGICSIASDLAIVTVNYVAEKLGLNGNSIAATKISTNKHEMRVTFEKNGDPSPRSYLIDKVTDFSSFDINYPIIVKPTDRSGSRGIRKLTGREGLAEAVKHAISESFEKKALIEEFVEGKEYSVEYISFKGQHHFLAITEKFTTGEPNFVETGHMEPANIDEYLVKKIKSVVEHALDSLKLENGASHSEIKIDNEDNIKIIEIGGRMGGDCIGSDLVRYSTGIDYVRAVIQVACNEEPDLTPVCESQAVMVKFLIDEMDMNEFQKIRKSENDSILQIVDYHPERIGKMTDSSNRAGCYIIKIL